MSRAGAIAAAALACLALAAGASAQTQARAGRFDYYLLALSWSPSYCAENGARDAVQCGTARRYAFAVHGLWPQNERGWPSDCVTNQPADVPGPLRRSMLDIMPSPRLVEHEWDEHGKCTGLSPQAYFDLTRRMHAKVITPPAFRDPQRTLMVTGAEVERAFVLANPGLTPAMLAVQCREGRLREVRVCLTRSGQPRACGADVRDRCTGKVAMPPVR